MIRTIIIDDEQHAVSRLEDLLALHCLEKISVQGSFASVEEGYAAIVRHRPELVFLDIRLHDKTAFDLLSKFVERDFRVIFTTAHDEYAVKAFRFSAADYLLKPIVAEDLVAAVNKVLLEQEKNRRSRQLEMLLHNMKQLQPELKKIGIATVEGLEFVPVADIVRCQSEANYSVIFLISGRKITVAKTLKEFEELLTESNFFRIHHSHLVNLRYVVKYNRGKGGSVMLQDQTELDVSVRRKDDLLKRMQTL